MAATTRRRMLGLLAALPVAGALGSRLARFVPAGLSRPTADGTSATRCAACGSQNHTMLAAGCPANPEGLV